jgi:hypothetical protein
MARRWLGNVVGASLLGLSFVLSGCVSLYYVHPGALEPSRAQIAPEERIALWRRAVGVLLDQGYVPQVLNESTFFISAKRREDFDNDPLAKTMVTLFISPEGAVRVELTGVGLYTSEKEFLREVGERQRKILDLLLNRRGGAAEPR